MVEFLGVEERLDNPGFDPLEFEGIRIRGRSRGTSQFRAYQARIRSL